jgi:hypothetical protein
MSRVTDMLRRSVTPAARRGGWITRAAAVAAIVTTAASCSSRFNDSQASSYLIINGLRGASGATPDQLGNTFNSDVLTYVKRDQFYVPTIFEDFGEIRLSLGMKNPSLAPTPTNYITVNRYRVNYVRADGRNTPGVDVPYPFDGAITMTVDETTRSASLTLVRIQSKLEAPLKAMVGSGGAIAISAIAEVTFYGTDQAGREASATGKILVTFSDWGDPE